MNNLMFIITDNYNLWIITNIYHKEY
jgi:hypothetical protein